MSIGRREGQQSSRQFEEDQLRTTPKPIMRQIHLNVGQRVEAAIGVWAGSGVIRDVWIVYAGHRLYDPILIPVGQRFEVHVSFSIQTTAFPIPFISTWSACITCIDLETKTIKMQYNLTNMNAINPAIIASSDQKLNPIAQGADMMPNSDITLRIKPWGNDSPNPPAPQYPMPTDTWL